MTSISSVACFPIIVRVSESRVSTPTGPLVRVFILLIAVTTPPIRGRLVKDSKVRWGEVLMSNVRELQMIVNLNIFENVVFSVD